MTELRDVQPDPNGARLFKVGKAKTVDGGWEQADSWSAHPGTLSPDQWHGRSDIGFHGTAIDSPTNIEGPTHFGDFGTAQGVARRLARNGNLTPGQEIKQQTPDSDALEDDAYYAESDEDEWGDPDPVPSGLRIGDRTQVFARRMPQQSPYVLSDMAANRAHVREASRRWMGVSPGVMESTQGSPMMGYAAARAEEGYAQLAATDLEEGKTIRYRNEGESSERIGSAPRGGPRQHRERAPGMQPANISYVANWQDTRGYADDVADATSRGLTPHPAAADHISSHQFGHVEIEEGHNRFLDQTQGQMFSHQSDGSEIPLGDNDARRFSGGRDVAYGVRKGAGFIIPGDPNASRRRFDAASDY